MAVLYVYREPANGDRFYGVPNRDITDAEWATFTLNQQRIVKEAISDEQRVWVHIDDADETEEERIAREAAEAAAREAAKRAARYIRGWDFDDLKATMDAAPTAEELTQMQADVAAVADVPAQVDALETTVAAKADASAVTAVDTKASRADSRTFDARAFLACDGVTDDRQAFQDLCDAVKAIGGGIIDFPVGTVLLDTAAGGAITWSGHANITLRGQGWNASEIVCTGPFLNASANSDQGTVDGLHIRCTTATNTHHGIRVDYPRRWNVTRCVIEWFGGDSVRFEGGLHSLVAFNRFSARDSANANGHAAIYFTKTAGGVQGTTNHTRHNYVVGGKEYGILAQDSRLCLFEGDVVEYCATGFRFERVDGALIQPYTEQISGNGIEMVDAAVTLIGQTMTSPPVVTWSGTAAAERSVPELSRRGVFAKTGAISSTNGTGDIAFTIRNEAYGVQTGNAILQFQGYGNYPAGAIKSARKANYTGTTGSSNADLVLMPARSGVNVEHLRVLMDGGLQMPNVTAVPPTPAAGGVLYVEGGSLKFKGSSGTVTTLGPA